MKTHGFHTSVACGLAVAAGLALCHGEETSAPVHAAAITLDQAIEAAMERNPSLAAARLRAAAARDRPAREGALPNPMVGASAEDRAPDFRVGGASMTKLEVEQPLPGFGKRSLRRQVAQADLETARLSVEEKRLGLKLSITEAAYGLNAAHKTVALIHGEVEILKQLESITRTKYATGGADQQDVIKAQAEVTMMQQRVIDAQSRVTSLKARLNTLMGRNADADLGEVTVPPSPAWPQPNLSNWLVRAESQNPDLGKARAMAARSRLEERLARREFFPDLVLRAEVTRDRGADETFVMLGIGVELPLQIAATRAGVREADRMARAAESELEAMRQETEYMLQDIASCCASAWQNLELLKTQLTPQAEARYKASESAYSAGKGDFLDLLESQRFRLNVRLTTVMTEAEVATQFARLERLLGGPIADAGLHKEGGR